MTETRACYQCGEVKPLDQFRKYSGKRGHRRVCLVCEKLNNRYTYLLKIPYEKLSEEQEAELNRYLVVYRSLEEAGIKVPSVGTRKPIDDSVLTKLADRALQIKMSLDSLQPDLPVEEIPHQLKEWLVKPLAAHPDRYLEIVYPDLRTKYMPILSYNPDGTPVRDQKYFKILDAILARFNEYEDTYDYGG